MKELGKRIRARRVKLGYSLKRVAAIAGKSHGWLFAIEKGQGNPKAEDITAIAIELGEDPKEYLRLAGRVSLAASDVTPLTQPSLPAGFSEAIAQAVAHEIAPLLDRLEQLKAPATTIQPATVIPSRDKKTRRVHWLALAMTRRGWTIAQAAAAIGRDATIVGRWINGTTAPRGAELRRLAEALDIPEALIETPPATDAERLARWHFGDDESQLRQAM